MFAMETWCIRMRFPQWESGTNYMCVNEKEQTAGQEKKISLNDTLQKCMSESAMLISKDVEFKVQFVL